MKVSTSLFARALATENIYVSFDTAAQSASFDLESRTLTIPDWNASDALRDMIVAHEVAHALYTPPEVHKNIVDTVRSENKKVKGFCACLNVIEDARIERLIKEKFPGCRRDFYEGYKEILEKDIFDLNNVDLAELSIIDKINIYFKFDILNLITVPLNSAEKKIIDRVNAAKTYEDVIDIARDLYDLAEAENKNKNQGDGDGDIKTNMEVAYDKLGRNGVADPERGIHDFKEFPFATYPLPKANSKEAIMSFKDIISEINNIGERNYKDYPKDTMSQVQNDLDMVTKNLEQFRNDTAGMVRELAMQFERRKAAEEIKRERMKDTGVINPDKLFQYKTHDDIFLRNLVKYEGKKHGMVMLVDWSGSMAECLDSVIRQTLIMTWFCRKVKIPFRVFLFTEDSCRYTDTAKGSSIDKRFAAAFPDAKKAPEGFELSPVCVREVMSSDMSDDEFKKMEHMMWLIASCADRNFYSRFSNCYATRRMVPRILELHGTPTNEALLVMHDYLPQFKASNGLDVVDFMLITDGEPTGLSPYGKYAYTPVKGVRVQHLATGRILTVPADSEGCAYTLNQAIQYFLVGEIQKLGVITVGFSIGNLTTLTSDLVGKFIDRDHWKKVTNLRNNNRSKHHSEIVAMESKLIAPYVSYYKKENFIPAAPELTPGFDEYYVMRPVRPQVEAPELPSGATLVRIRNTFLKSLTGRKHSRVFLSRFIDLIAGRKVAKFKMN